MEAGGKPELTSSLLTSLPAKQGLCDSSSEIRECDSGGVRKHPSILLTDGRTLTFKKADRKRVSFGKNTEFPISQVSLFTQDEVPKPPVDQPMGKSDFERYLEGPLSYHREVETVISEAIEAANQKIMGLFQATEKVNDELASRLGIDYRQPSESQLSELIKANSVLQSHISDLEMRFNRLQDRLELDKSEQGHIEEKLTATQQQVEQSIESKLMELKKKKERLLAEVDLYRRMTGVSLLQFSGNVMTGMCKGLAGGELKFELRFKGEDGCTYNPISLQLHGLDEMLKHPITRLADCELVMIFRRMLSAVIYKPS